MTGLWIYLAAASAAAPADSAVSAQLWLEQRGEQWRVYANQTPLDGHGLARALGDVETLARIEADRERTRRRALTLAGVGLGLIAAAPLPARLVTPTSADDIDPGVLDPNETRFEELEHQQWITQQDSTWAGVFLGVSGALVVGAAVATARSHGDRRADSSVWYTPEEIAARVEDHALDGALSADLALAVGGALGQVLVRGDVESVCVETAGPAGCVAPGDPIAPGTYTLSVSFDGEPAAPQMWVDIYAGGITTVRCSAVMSRCRAIE